MRIGVWLRYNYKPTAGGGFSYYDALVAKLMQLSPDNGFELCFLSAGSMALPVGEKTCIPLRIIPDRLPFTRMLFSRFPILLKAIMRINVSLKKRQYQRILRRNDIKLVYYLNQDDILLDGVPFISTIWDIGYFSTFPFPELASGRNFEGRYRRLRYDLQKALMVFVESEAGKRDLTQFAGIAPCRIRVVPIFAGNVTFLNVPDIDQNAAMERFGLSKYHYFFYPAQFWAHKNHIAVIEAFSLLVQRHPDYKLVFCGSDKGNIEYIKRVAISSSAASQIVFLGFVSNEEMNALYRNATALVMSSYFGPTNMPPIEAMMLSCPVICTDLDGHREILEDAALYFSAMDYIDLLDKMEIMVENRDTYVSLIQKRKTESPFTIEHAIECISRNLCEASVIRSTWD